MRYELTLLITFLVISGIFSAAETAFITLNKIHLHSMREMGLKNTERVRKIIESPQKLLSTILIGNNFVNVSASAIAASLAIKLSGEHSLFVTTIILTFVILIFSEITPKHIANQHPQKIADVLAKPIAFCVWLFTPIVFILNLITNGLIVLLGGKPGDSPRLITESDLKAMVDVSHEEGVLEIDERQMINNVFAFGDSDAKDVMLPRTDIIAISSTVSYDEIQNVFKSEGFSRIPVYKENIDDIIGILHLKDFMFMTDKNTFELEKIIREPFFTHEYKPTRELFTTMRIKRIPMAIILDEYGGTAGLITLEDLIEEIVGDIDDEYDEPEQQIEPIRDNEYVIDGSTKIDDVSEQLGVKLESEDFDSIGGYLIGVLGYFPKPCEVVETAELKFIIEEVDKNRIEKIRVIKK